MRTDEVGKKVWENLERIRVTAAWEAGELAARLDLSVAEYSRRRMRSKWPPLTACSRLLEELDIPFDAMCGDGQIDFGALALRLKGNRGNIPERYLVGAYSRKRTSISVLRYVEQFYGWRAAHGLLRSVQLNPVALSSADEMVNIRLVTDLCDELAKRGFSRDTLYEIGLSAAAQGVNHSLRDALSGVMDTREAFERVVCDHIGHFEFNHHYRLSRLSRGEVEITLLQAEEVKDSLGTEKVGSENACHYRAGVMGSFPAFAGLPTVRMEEIHCVHRGDYACVFRADIDSAASSTRPFSRFHVCS